VTEQDAMQVYGGCRLGDESSVQANTVRANGSAVRPQLSTNCRYMELLQRSEHLEEKTRGKSEVVEPSVVLPANNNTMDILIYEYPWEWSNTTLEDWETFTGDYGQG
jgi:hypothetical protein